MRASLFSVCGIVVVLTTTGAALGDVDVERALAAARVKAVAGDVVAQFSLGAMLYYGGDDTAQAIAWFRKAAAQDYPPAEFQMGQLYDFGFGVTQSDAEALRWYRRAAEHGSAPGQRAVGDFYQKGRVVAADAAEAQRWYRRGADGDDVRAQYQLGEMYFTGTGVPRDYASAYLWFSLAASQAPLVDNRKGLLELRNIAAARMTPEQVADAARRVAAWKPPPARARQTWERRVEIPATSSSPNCFGACAGAGPAAAVSTRDARRLQLEQHRQSAPASSDRWCLHRTVWRQLDPGVLCDVVIFNFSANLAGIVTPLVIGYAYQSTGSFFGPLVYIAIVALVGAFSYSVILGDIHRLEGEH